MLTLSRPIGIETESLVSGSAMSSVVLVETLAATIESETGAATLIAPGTKGSAVRAESVTGATKRRRTVTGTPCPHRA